MEVVTGKGRGSVAAESGSLGFSTECHTTCTPRPSVRHGPRAQVRVQDSLVIGELEPVTVGGWGLRPPCRPSSKVLALALSLKHFLEPCHTAPPSRAASFYSKFTQD